MWSQTLIATKTKPPTLLGPNRIAETQDTARQGLVTEARRLRKNEISRKSRAKQKAKDPEAFLLAHRIRVKQERKTTGVVRRRSEKRKRAKKTAFSVNFGSRWRDEEIAMIFDSRHLDAELSKLLGRSVNSIQIARWRHAKSAPPNWCSKGTPAVPSVVPGNYIIQGGV